LFKKDTPTTSRFVTLSRLADQCVKCGYCLSVCPTFALYQDEAESPRGRIALIQGWLTHDLSDHHQVFVHLERCLMCRACETVCPSLVQFGVLMDGARAQRQVTRPNWQQKLSAFWWTWLSLPRSWSVLAMIMGWLRCGWSRIPVRRLWRFKRPWFGALLTTIVGISRRLQSSQRRQSFSSTTATTTVQLFLGCIARTTQQPTLNALQAILQQMNIAYDYPERQTCCGALLRHNGHPAQADQWLEQNAQAFAADSVIVGYASACVAELCKHPKLDVVEVCQFLVTRPELMQLRVRPLTATVLVHEPCSHRYLLQDTKSVYALLHHIPNLVVKPLPDNEHCCGAAGSYLLTQPDIATRLAAPKLAAIQYACPDYVVTTNTGCALHLEAQLQAAQLSIPVIHPIELFAQQVSDFCLHSH
jgi:glycolate oxidase iron-sulfur subunit